MDADLPAVGDADSPAPEVELTSGQDVEVSESGRPVGGATAGLTPDGAVVWIRVVGRAPRPMYLGGNPAEVIPEQENPDAF